MNNIVFYMYNITMYICYMWIFDFMQKHELTNIVASCTLDNPSWHLVVENDVYVLCVFEIL